MTIETPTLWNTGLPLLLSALLAWILPRFIAPPRTRSHKSVGLAVAASALALVFASAAMFAALQPDKCVRAAETAGLLLAIEIALRGSFLFVIAWGPILVLNWFNMAQRVEMWRGKDMVAKDQ